MLLIKNKIYILLILLVLVPLFIISRTRLHKQSKKIFKPSNKSVPQRIISLAPSITELIFALGAGERIVGVTRFCDYPEEAKKLPRIGGFYDPNYEAIISLEPDMIILLSEHEAAVEYFSRVGLPSFEVNHRTIGEIMHSIDILGALLNKKSKAGEILGEWNGLISYVRGQLEQSDKPAVLMTLGREIDNPKSIYIVGKDGVYDELLKMAGGINAYNGIDIRYPMVSREGVLRMNPDIIIEIVSERDGRLPDIGSYAVFWENFEEVKAVKNGAVHYITKPYAVRPGPRFVYLLKDMAEIINPDIEWTEVWKSLELKISLSESTEN